MTKIDEYLASLEKEIKKKKDIVEPVYEANLNIRNTVSNDNELYQNTELLFGSIKAKYEKFKATVSVPWKTRNGEKCDALPDFSIIDLLLVSLDRNNFPVNNRTYYGVEASAHRLMDSINKSDLAVSGFYLNNSEIGLLLADQKIFNEVKSRLVSVSVDSLREQTYTNWDKIIGVSYDEYQEGHMLIKRTTDYDDPMLFYSIVMFLRENQEQLTPEVQMRFLNQRNNILSQISSGEYSIYSYAELVALLESQRNREEMRRIFGEEVLLKYFGKSLEATKRDLQTLNQAVSDITLSKKIDSLTEEEASDLYLDLTDDQASLDKMTEILNAIASLKEEYATNPELQGFDYEYDPRYQAYQADLAKINEELASSRRERKTQASGDFKEMLKQQLQLGKYRVYNPEKAASLTTSLEERGVTLDPNHPSETLRSETAQSAASVVLINSEDPSYVDSNNIHTAIRNRNWYFSQMNLYAKNSELFNGEEFRSIEELASACQDARDSINSLTATRNNIITEIQTINNAIAEYDEMSFFEKKRKHGQELQAIINNNDTVKASYISINNKIEELKKSVVEKFNRIMAIFETFKQTYSKAFNDKHDSVYDIINYSLRIPPQFFGDLSYDVVAGKIDSCVSNIAEIKTKYNSLWQEYNNNYANTLKIINEIIAGLPSLAVSAEEISDADLSAYAQSEQEKLDMMGDLRRYYDLDSEFASTLSPEAYAALREAAEQELMSDEEFEDAIDQRLGM